MTKKPAPDFPPTVRVSSFAKQVTMNPLRIPAFILRGLICAAHENWEAARELADIRRRLKAMR